MIEQGFKSAKGFGQAPLLLERYFLSVLVTKAKSNVVAYERSPAKKQDVANLRKKAKRSN